MYVQLLLHMQALFDRVEYKAAWH